MLEIQLTDYITLYSSGLFCGFVLTLVPYAIGEVIKLAIKIMQS